MNKKIKTFLMVFVLFALFAMISTLKLSAAGIILDDNDNPDYSTVLGFENCSYEIIVDEQSGVGYVYYETRGQYEIVGTCEVFINDLINNIDYTLCYNGENSIGKIIITIDEYNTFVSFAEGDISNVFVEGIGVEIYQ